MTCWMTSTTAHATMQTVVYLVEKISILQIFHGLLQYREGLIEEERQGDVGQVLA